MSEVYKIVLETSDGMSFSGTMSRREPQLVNGFIAMQTDSGSWNYEKPDNVKRWTATPVEEAVTESPATEASSQEEPVESEEVQQDSASTESGEETEADSTTEETEEQPAKQTPEDADAKPA